MLKPPEIGLFLVAVRRLGICGINDINTATDTDVTTDPVEKELALADTGFTDDIRMGAAVGQGE
jgi:hypothetical protein